MLDWNLANPNAYTSFVDDTKLWHKRLGQVNYNSLSQICEVEAKWNLRSIPTWEVDEVTILSK